MTSIEFFMVTPSFDGRVRASGACYLRIAIRTTQQERQPLGNLSNVLKLQLNAPKLLAQLAGRLQRERGRASSANTEVHLKGQGLICTPRKKP